MTTIGPLRGKNIWRAEKIIDERHRKVKGKNILEFLVKWIGFDEKQSTWEPRHNLLNKVLLEDWRKDHRPALRYSKKKINRKTRFGARKVILNDHQNAATITLKKEEKITESFKPVSAAGQVFQLEPTIDNTEEIIYIGSTPSKRLSKSANNVQIEVITIEDDDDV